MPVVTLAAPIYHRIIDGWTSPTERLVYPGRAKQLPDGRMQFNLPDAIAERLQGYMFEGESYDDAIERLMAEASGRIS